MAACLALNLAAPRAVAQTAQGTFDASKLQEPADLNSPWVFHPGDDPAYARPDFDDSNWTTFDPHTDIKTVLKTNHPDVVWYRIHVKVRPDESGLAIQEFNLSLARLRSTSTGNG